MSVGVYRKKGRKALNESMSKGVLMKPENVLKNPKQIRKSPEQAY